MKQLLAIALVPTICSYITPAQAADEDIWPMVLLQQLYDGVLEKPDGIAVWHGGTGIEESTGKPVGLVIWSASGGPKAQIELVVSCFDEVNYQLPQIVAYINDVSNSKPSVDVSYRYDSKAEQPATWRLIDNANGGLFAHVDGDIHVRNMMASNDLTLNTPRADGSIATYSFALSGFTREFSKSCSWHPNYANWIAKPVASKTPDFENKIRAFAKREYPDDKRMQNFVFEKQAAALRYLGTVADIKSLVFAQREYPEDYAMQKYTYDKQTAAKRYIQSVDDAELKAFSAREYPEDFAMQKFTYDKQFSAKQYMSSAGNTAAKAKAEREWPLDYAMQKYTYDREAF